MRRVILLGNSNVGKTTILKSLLPEKSELQDPTNTACARFYYYTTGDADRHLEICDTAGMERYHSLAAVFAREASAGIIVFDLSDPESFHGVENWRQMLVNYAQCEDVGWVLVGNKSDLRQAVDPDELRRYVEEHGVSYFRVCAKTGEGVTRLFQEVGKMVEGMAAAIDVEDLDAPVDLSIEQKEEVPWPWSCC